MPKWLASLEISAGLLWGLSSIAAVTRMAFGRINTRSIICLAVISSFAMDINPDMGFTSLPSLHFAGECQAYIHAWWWFYILLNVSRMGWTVQSILLSETSVAASIHLLRVFGGFTCC